MDFEKAIDEVSNIGYGYFYDWVDIDDEEIVNEIRANFSSAGRNLASQQIRLAFDFILENSSDDVMDDLVMRYFNRSPENVGGSRAFLRRILDAMQGRSPQETS